MNDKAGIAANQDYGRDEDAAVKALKKHGVRELTLWHTRVLQTGNRSPALQGVCIQVVQLLGKQISIQEVVEKAKYCLHEAIVLFRKF